MAVFPEYTMYWHRNRHGGHDFRSVAQPLSGAFVDGLAESARDAGVWVVAGVIESPDDPEGLAYNTTVILDSAGFLVASYRKSHLFDAFGYLESDDLAAGDRLFEPIPTPLGRAAVLVCYELRFPEVSRRLVLDGAEVLLVPSAWVEGRLKEQQWRTLVMARAIENACYVVAPGQTGNGFIGDSLIVDPMGLVLAEAGVEEDILVAEVDRSRVESARVAVPALAQRHPELYREREMATNS